MRMIHSSVPEDAIRTRFKDLGIHVDFCANL